MKKAKLIFFVAVVMVGRCFGDQEFYERSVKIYSQLECILAEAIEVPRAEISKQTDIKKFLSHFKTEKDVEAWLQDVQKRISKKASCRIVPDQKDKTLLIWQKDETARWEVIFSLSCNPDGSLKEARVSHALWAGKEPTGQP